MHLAPDICSFSCDCHNDHHSFHQKMMSLLAEMGVTFFKNGPYPPDAEENPLSRFKPDGRLILAVPFMHTLLESRQDDIELKHKTNPMLRKFL